MAILGHHINVVEYCQHATNKKKQETKTLLQLILKIKNPDTRSFRFGGEI